MLGRHLADKGVGLYLRYSQTLLANIMNEGLEADSEVESKQNAETAEMEEGVRIQSVGRRSNQTTGRSEKIRSACHGMLEIGQDFQCRRDTSTTSFAHGGI
eukprot:774184_1